jgi:hypothetical protein
VSTTEVTAYVVRESPPPGRLSVVGLEDLEVLPDRLRTARLTVEDLRGGSLLSGEDTLRSDPRLTDGHAPRLALDGTVRAFSLTNVAWAAGRLLQRVEACLGLELPPLRIVVGCHDHGRRHWSGGHYRLPATFYSELPEVDPVVPTGEVHLGYGREFVEHEGARYLHSPGHDVALVSHEVAHHVCRHVADFRLNALRPALQQSNRRTAVEEGTCDYLAALMISHPDIYGWHRGHLPLTDPRRRSLAAPWTMDSFRGGHDADPHADGTIWAAALWEARARAPEVGYASEYVDAALLHGLARLGRERGLERDGKTRRMRRYYGTLLTAVLEAAGDASLAGHVERVMARRGIRAGWSNAYAREVARGRA